MRKGISGTRKCSVFITPSVIKSVFHPLVLSRLEYCLLIWSSASKSDRKQLHIAHHKAAHVAFGFSYKTGIHNMHAHLAQLMGEEKMSLHLLMLFAEHYYH